RPGKVVVSNDEWAFTDAGFTAASDTERFVDNVAGWFTGGQPGSFLAYSSNHAFNQSSLAAAMRRAGHSLIVSTSLPFTLATLENYNGVFVGGNMLDNQVLIDYVNAGGNVYLAGGTGVLGSAAMEAADWNTFAGAFGLALAPAFNGITGTTPTRSTLPIFQGVSALSMNNGTSVFDLNPADPRVQWAPAPAGGGLSGVYAGPPAGPPYTYQVVAHDADNDPLTYSLTTAPAGMTIDPSVGLIGWTPPGP